MLLVLRVGDEVQPQRLAAANGLHLDVDLVFGRFLEDEAAQLFVLHLQVVDVPLVFAILVEFQYDEVAGTLGLDAADRLLPLESVPQRRAGGHDVEGLAHHCHPDLIPAILLLAAQAAPLKAARCAREGRVRNRRDRIGRWRTAEGGRATVGRGMWSITTRCITGAGS